MLSELYFRCEDFLYSWFHPGKSHALRPPVSGNQFSVDTETDLGLEISISSIDSYIINLALHFSPNSTFKY